jgi:hypothetical protein
MAVELAILVVQQAAGRAADIANAQRSIDFQQDVGVGERECQQSFGGARHGADRTRMIAPVRYFATFKELLSRDPRHHFVAPQGHAVCQE